MMLNIILIGGVRIDRYILSSAPSWYVFKNHCLGRKLTKLFSPMLVQSTLVLEDDMLTMRRRVREMVMASLQKLRIYNHKTSSSTI